MNTQPYNSNLQDRSRGQLILFGAVLLVLVLISLAILLNTVLVAENVESQQSAVETSAALDTTTSLQTLYANAFAYENSQRYDSENEAIDNTERTLDAISTGVNTHSIYQHGIHTDVERTNIVPGTVLRQDNSECTFDSAETDCTEENGDDWTLTTTPAVRDFTFDVAEDDMNTSLTLAESTSSTIARSEAFHVLVTDSSGNEWRLFIHSTPDDELTVSTQDNDDAIEIQYQEQIDSATINLSSGAVNGNTTPVSPANSLDDSDWTIEFRNGGAAHGVYKLIIPSIDSSTATIHTSNFYSSTESSSPYYAYGVYSSQHSLTYASVSLLYETQLTIAPNETTGVN